MTVRASAACAAAWVVLLVLAGAASSAGQEPSATEVGSGAIHPVAGAALAPAHAARLAQWRAEARRTGSVRVVVTLSTPSGQVASRADRLAAHQRVVARASAHVTNVRPLASWPVLAADADDEGLARLAADPEVQAIELDQVVGHLLSESTRVIEADQRWAAGMRGDGWTVAVLDDGVDGGHPAFAGRIVSEACFSGGGVRSSSLCPGGALSATGPGAAAPCVTCRHGTHVAGIAAGTTGTAPGSGIIAVQVFSRGGGAFVSDILAGLDRVYALRSTYRIAAVNLSLSGSLFSSRCDSYSPATAVAFSTLRAAGIAPVVAAGNNGSSSALGYPACISSAVSVSATTKADVIDTYANTADFLDLLAPGSGIEAPVPGGGTAVMSGTSMAAPHVTGAWALLRQAEPEAGVDAVLAALQATGLGVRRSTGPTFPRVRAQAAAVALAAPPAPSFTLSPSDVSLPGGGGSASVRLDADSSSARWSASATEAWLSVTPSAGTGSATLIVSAATNPALSTRRGTLTIAGQVLSVQQGAGTPDISVTPTTWQAPAEGGTQAVRVVSRDTTAPWNVVVPTEVASPRWHVTKAGARAPAGGASAPWLTASPTSGRGDGVVTLTATPNLSPLPRTATMLIAGRSFAITQDAPRRFSRYLAEGATSGLFDTRLALLNPGTVGTWADVEFLIAGRTRPIGHRAWLPPATRQTIWPRDIIGEAAFSTVVTADAPLVVERSMSWDVTAYGAHAEAAVPLPARTWYFAEGATHGGFDLFYLLQNPAPTSTTVRVRYLRAQGGALEKRYVLEPWSRTNIWVNVEEFAGLGRALAEAECSAVVEVIDGTPIIAERAMYRSRAGRLFDAGHASMGVTEPATRWFLAEGATGPYFDQFVLIANPGATDARVRLTYLLTDGRVYARMLLAPAGARTTVWVDREQIPGVPGHPLANVALSTSVESVDGVPLVVERAMWWPGQVETWHEAHNSAGATQTGARWALADGEVGGPRAMETYVLIANLSPRTGSARVRLLFEDGTSTSRVVALAPQSRTDVAVGQTFGATVAGRRFGAIVEAMGDAPVELVVERSMYGEASGVTWAAGTSVVGTRLP